jgi:hypothetical protein
MQEEGIIDGGFDGIFGPPQADHDKACLTKY